MDLSRPLRALAWPLVSVARVAARAARRSPVTTALQVGTPARRRSGVDSAALAAATVDTPARGSASGSASCTDSDSGTPVSTPQPRRSGVRARIEEVEQRFAMDELVLNQQRGLHAELASRVARLESGLKESALERQARLAALEREAALEERLNLVELLTTAHSPARGVALLRRAASAPRPGSAGSTLARSLGGVAEAAEDDSSVDTAGAPPPSPPPPRALQLTPPHRGGSEAEADGPAFGSPQLRENTPPPDGTPTPVRVRPGRAASPRSPPDGCDSDSSANSDASFAGSAYSGYSASVANSPAWGTVMQQIPAFGGSQPPTPRSSARRGPPPRQPSASPRAAAAARSGACSCRDPASPEGSPTIHAEGCGAQACAAAAQRTASVPRSAGKPPLRRATSTPPLALAAALSAAA